MSVEEWSCVSDEPLTEDDLPKLMLVLFTVKTKWENFGVQLGVPASTIEAIKKDCQSDPSNCLREMLVYWLRNKKTSWRRVCEAVSTKAGGSNKRVAQDIRAKYGKWSSDVDRGTAAIRKHSKHHWYRDYLISYYKSHFSYPGDDGKFPNIRIDRYMELTIVEGLPRDFSYASACLPNHDQSRKSIPISEIACHCPSKILIVGAPGVGKTSLVKQLCFEWSKGNLLQQYELVVMIQLRDRSTLKAINLSSIVFPDDKIRARKIAKKLFETKGHNTLFIFDGYDEAPAELEKSMVQRLMDGITLPLATVLITSRPMAVEDKLGSPKFHQKLEVQGFSPLSMFEYASVVLGKNESAFVLYLVSHPHILALACNPLNCAIITEAFRYELEQQLSPQPLLRITDIYTNLTLSLLMRYISRNGKRNFKLKNYNQLSNKHRTVNRLFWELALFAFDTLKVKRFIFNDESLSEEILHLGFFQSHPQLYVCKDASSNHSFFHRTIQEYLAALHASKLSSEEQYAFIKATKQELGDDMHFIFLAGLTGLSAFTPEQLLQLYPDNYSNTVDRGDTLNMAMFESQSPCKIRNIFDFICEYKPLKQISIQTIMMIVPLHSYVIGYLFAVSHQPWHFNLELDDSFFIVVHFLILGFRAGGAKCDQQISIRFEGFKENFTDDHVNCLLEFPNCILENVQDVSFHRVDISCNFRHLFKLWFKMPSLFRVHCVLNHWFFIEISSNWAPSAKTILLSLIFIPCRVYLQTTPFDNTSDLIGLQFFKSKLRSINRDIKWVEFWSDDFDDVLILNLYFHPLTRFYGHPLILELSLYSPIFSIIVQQVQLVLAGVFRGFVGTFLSEHCVTLPYPLDKERGGYTAFGCITTFSNETDSSEEPYISFMYTPYSYQVSLGILSVMSHLHCLELVNLSHCTLAGTGVLVSLGSLLMANLLPVVSSLDISYNSITMDIMTSLTPVLSHCHQLHTLKLTHCSFSLRALTQLASCVCHSRHVTHLDLSGNMALSIVKNLGIIAGIFGHNNALRTATLHRCGFTPASSHQLATALHKRRVLKNLHISSDLIISTRHPVSETVRNPFFQHTRLISTRHRYQTFFSPLLRFQTK